MKVKRIDERYSSKTTVIDVGCIVHDHVSQAVDYPAGVIEATEDKVIALTDILSALVDTMVGRGILQPEELKHIISDYGVEYEHVENDV